MSIIGPPKFDITFTLANGTSDTYHGVKDVKVADKLEFTDVLGFVHSHAMSQVTSISITPVP